MYNNTTLLHPFNGPFSGTTQVSQYQKGKTNLDFTEARDSEWQWHQLGHIQVCTSLQTDNHASTPPLQVFYRPDALPAAQPTASKHWRLCTTITMKITIFTIVLVLKSNDNVEMWYSRLSQLANSSKPCKNSLFQDVFKVSAPSFHTSSKSFYKAQYGLVDGVLWQIIPYCLQDFLQLVNGIWLGLKCLVAFRHSSPDMVIKRIKVWWVW